MKTLFRVSLPLVFVLLLSSCSQWCDCTPTQAKTDTAEQSPRLMQEMQSVESDAPLNELPDRRMAEASVSIPAEPLSPQLEQLLAAEAAKGQVMSQTAPLPVIAPPATQLQRRMIPSESAQSWSGDMAWSGYPELPNNRKELTDYVAQLAFKLAGDLQLTGIKMGVASFVEFDESLRQTNPLGNQLAEAMATALPEYGVQVIEFKLTRDLAIGPQGDFVLSRNVKNLQRKVGMDYILVGTLVTTRRGVQVNSRIVSVQQHKVIAAASTLIPHLVLQQIQP